MKSHVSTPVESHPISRLLHRLLNMAKHHWMEKVLIWMIFILHIHWCIFQSIREKKDLDIPETGDKTCPVSMIHTRCNYQPDISLSNWVTNDFILRQRSFSGTSQSRRSAVFFKWTDKRWLCWMKGKRKDESPWCGGDIYMRFTSSLIRRPGKNLSTCGNNACHLQLQRLYYAQLMLTLTPSVSS